MKTITAIGIIAVLGLVVYFIYKATTTTTKATSTTTVPQEYKPAYTPAVQPENKDIVRFVPPPPPSILSWAVKGYWEIGPEGSLLAPITPAMAFHYSAGIPSYVIAWYKQNYPQYSGEV